MKRKKYLNSLDLNRPRRSLIHLVELLEKKDKEIEELIQINDCLSKSLSEVSSLVSEYTENYEDWKKELESLVMYAFLKGKQS